MIDRNQVAQGLRRQNAQLKLLAQAAVELLRAGDPDAMVRRLFHSLAEQLEVDLGFNYMVNGASDALHLDAYTGIAAEEAKRISQLPFGQAVCGVVAQTQRPIYVAHIQESDDPLVQLVKRYGGRAYACYPLLVGSRLLGTLSFGARHRDRFDEDELDFFRTISLFVSLAKERKGAEAEREQLLADLQHERLQLQQLNETLEQKVQERTEQVRKLAADLTRAEQQERRRLAQDLHDSAGQLLTALQIHLQLLADQIPEQLGSLRHELAEATDLVQKTQDEVRAVSHAMRPPALDQLGLNSALQALCREFGDKTGLQIHYQGAEPPPIDDQVSIAFYRFLQEALTNAAKHASASAVTTVFSVADHQLSLAVEDDGVGFSVTHQLARANGIGLQGLVERFNLLGGRVEVDSAPGQGTRLVARCQVSSI